jgi:hypothetical protein
MDLDKIEKQLRENEIAIIVMPKTNYSENIMKLIKTISKISNSICYVSANKPEKTLIKMLNENDIDPKKFLIIDCISEREEHKKDKSIFVKSPTNLTGVNLAIKEAIDLGIDSVFIDAISTFMIYEQGVIVVRFAHNIITKLREIEKKCIFIVMKEDINRALLDDLDMFVDVVCDYE